MSKKLITSIFYALVALITIIGFYFMFIASDSIGEKPEVMLQDENIQKGTSILMTFSGIILAICALAMIIFPVVNIIQHPKAAGKTFIGLGVLLVVFLIGYATASSEVVAGYEKFGIDTPGKSQLVGALLNSTYILLGLTVVAYVYSAVTNVIKQA